MAFLMKFLSRKFLTAVGALVVAYFGVTNPDIEGQVQTYTTTIVSSVLAIVPIVYQVMQGKIDRAEAEKNT